MMNFEEITNAIDLALSREERDRARELWRDLQPAGPEQEWLSSLLKLWLASHDPREEEWYAAPDEHAILVDALIDSPHADKDAAERALLGLTGLHYARRRKDATRAILERSKGKFGVTGRYLAALGGFHMMFDDRATAKDVLLAAEVSHPSAHVDMAIARLMYVVADFDAAIDYASRISHYRYVLDATDLIVAVGASTANVALQLDSINKAIDLAPNSEHASGRLLHRGFIHADRGDLESAKADLRACLTKATGEQLESLSSYVEHRLAALDAAGPTTKHRRLTAFPTVLQKWNYCGPAVIELCLRYAGIEMTQDLIAAAVKRGEGTTMPALMDFLREQGIEARRVEATPERLKAAVDLGVPVIVEDDFSNSHHVSVVTGYDDRLGILIIADPNTHAPRIQGIEYRKALAEEHRYSAVAVLGRTEDIGEPLRAALDAAGLTESEPLAILDSLSVEVQDISPAYARRGLLETGGVARAALAVRPDFPRAVVLEAQSRLAAALPGSHATAQHLARARRDLPGLSELASLAGAWNHAVHQRGAAIAEHVIAASINPDDAKPRADLAWSLMHVGDRALAYRSATQAFMRAPSEASHTALLARIVVDELIARADERGTLGTLGQCFRAPEPPHIATGIAAEDAVLEALADRLVDAAIDMAPDDPAAHLARADLFLLRGKHADAATTYRHASSLAPLWSAPEVRLAHALEAAGDPGALATAIAAANGNIDQKSLGDILGIVARLGSAQDIANQFARAIRRSDQAQALLGSALVGFLRTTGSRAEAAELLIALASDAGLIGAEAQLASILADHTLVTQAVGLLEPLVEASPDSPYAKFLLCGLLMQHPDTRARALELSTQLVDQTPHWGDAILRYGWLAAADSTQAALHQASKGPEASIEFSALREHLYLRLSMATEAERESRRLVALAGSREAADFAIARSHLAAGRAYELSAMTVTYLPPADDVEAVAAWLRVKRFTGGSDVAAYLADAPQLLEDADVARAAVDLGPGIGTEQYVTACRTVAAHAHDAPESTRMRTFALLAQQRWTEALELATGDALSLAACARWHPDPATRLELAHTAVSLATDEPLAIAAWHSAALTTGLQSEAEQAAARLHEVDPLGHRAAETAAVNEALWGAVSQAEERAQVAVQAGPDSWKAWSSLAVAQALAGVWVGAGGAASNSVDRNHEPAHVRDADPARMVLAAAQQDQSAFDRALACARTFGPDAPLDRLVTACEARLNG